MTDKFFNEMDSAWMKELKTLREKKTPPQILENFAHSVETRLRHADQKPQTLAPPQRNWVPVWAPVFAVLVLASFVVWRMPLVSSPANVEFSKMSMAEISEEISELKDLGIWTQDDEKVLGNSLEDEAEVLEA